MDNGLSYRDILNRLNLPEPAELVHGQRRIHQAMRKLPEAQRIVLVLASFYGYSRSEVATVLRVPPEIVHGLHLYGLRQVRALM